MDSNIVKKQENKNLFVTVTRYQQMRLFQVLCKHKKLTMEYCKSKLHML